MIKRVLLILFIFFSFVTRTIDENGENPVFSRLTLSDIFGVLALLIGFKALIIGFYQVQSFSGIYKACFLLLICLFAPIFFSLNMEATILECLILLYLILISLLLFVTFREKFETLLLPLLMYTVIAAFVVGIYDYAAIIIGLPRIFPSRSSGELISGFRNAGQAGAYFLIAVTILFPLRFSSIYGTFSAKNKQLLNISLIVSILFLILSGKIAAYIGIFVGFLGYAIMKRNTRTIFSLSALAVVILVMFINLDTIAPKMYERIAYKYETRISQNLRGDISEGDFLVTNLGRAVEAFKERPLTGSGLGAFVGPYGDHEVHSTYFKMFGETGIIGVLGYIMVVIYLIRLFKQGTRFSNKYSSYLKAMIPFIIGCFVSWAYTYHLRKREFWLLLAVILITIYRGIQEQNNEYETSQKKGWSE
jgi:O-antigen ligase